MTFLIRFLAIIILLGCCSGALFAQNAVTGSIGAKFIKIDQRSNGVVGFYYTRNASTKQPVLGIGTVLPTYNFEVSGSVKINKPVLFNIVTITDPTAIDWRKGSVQRLTMGRPNLHFHLGWHLNTKLKRPLFIQR
jgi:hypothetical protein